VNLDYALLSLRVSAREREVAALVVEGRSEAIASGLRISPWTVQDHLTAVYAKTGRGRSDPATLAHGAFGSALPG
jgi:DNA-binding CsgD family transcriptional regulator